MVGNVFYVDKVGNNYLYRGGAALTTSSGRKIFDYDGLRSAIATAPNPPAPPPKWYYLVVINLEHSNEGDELTAEIDFFSNWSDLGQVHLWDTNGVDPAPAAYQCYYKIKDPNQLDAMLTTLGEWLPDPLIWRVATLRGWLENPATLPIKPPPDPDQPVLVYVHCDGGVDRTSEMIGAYQLRYPPAGWTPENTWVNMCNENPPKPRPRPMGCGNYMAVQWYAFWLKKAHGYSIKGIGQNDGGCTDGRSCSPD
jgi:hypothetical protein